MPRLFVSNVPCDCPDAELRGWIESHGFDVDSLRVVRDLVAGASPAFAYVSLPGSTDQNRAIQTLDGQNLKGRRLQVIKDWRNEHYRG